MPLEDENLLELAQQQQQSQDPNAQPQEQDPAQQVDPNATDPNVQEQADPNQTDPNAQPAGQDQWPADVPRDEAGKRPSENTVDFDKLKEHLPPEVYETVERRFRSLYKQTKAQDRYLDTLSRDFGEKFERLTQQDQAKDKDLADIRTAVENLRSKDVDDAERLQEENLRKELVKAKEEMNFTREVEIQDEMAEIKAQRLFRKAQAEVQANQPAAQPAPNGQDTQPAPQPDFEQPASQPATQPQGGLTPTQRALMNEWAQEQDKNGNYVRPWAVNQNHQLFNYAYQQAAAYLATPQGQAADFYQLLGLVDQAVAQVSGNQRPRPQQQQRRPAPEAPLAGNRDVRTIPNKDEVQLSPEQKTTAHRMFYDLSPAEAEKKYLAGYKAQL